MKSTLLLLLLAATLLPAFAQDPPPSPKAMQAADSVGNPLFAPVAVGSSPQTVHQKFMDYAIISFGPRALLTPVFRASLTMLNPPDGYPREWRQGMGAFGRNYGAALATRTSQQTARFLTAAALHEDFRYHPSASKNPWVRGFHAIGYTFVDKSDSGSNRIAFANFAGAAAAGFTPNLYLPERYNTLSRAETRMAFTFGEYAVRNLTREFAPELFKVARKLHLPATRFPIPEWWKRN